MIWKRDGNSYTASEGGCDFNVYKTVSYPPRAIPVKERWTLDIIGPWYMCKCFPRRSDCFNAAERVLVAMPILEEKE